MTQENHASLDNLPPEIRNNIMRQAMRGAPAPRSQAEAFCTANALRQASPNYQQTLASNPATLGAEFQQLASDTVAARAEIARAEVGGPGEERTADSVLARRGPFPPAETERVRRDGALKDVRDHDARASDAITRHVVENEEHKNQIFARGAKIACNGVGGPGEERTADSVLARRGPFPLALEEDVRLEGALNDVETYDARALDAILRHAVKNQTHQDSIFQAGADFAVTEVGGPGQERTADSFLARRGPFPKAVEEDVRLVGALNDVETYGARASDAIARHVVNQTHQAKIFEFEQARLQRGSLALLRSQMRGIQSATRGRVRRLGGSVSTSLNSIAGSIVNAGTAAEQIVRRLGEPANAMGRRGLEEQRRDREGERARSQTR